MAGRDDLATPPLLRKFVTQGDALSAIRPFPHGGTKICLMGNQINHTNCHQSDRRDFVSVQQARRYVRRSRRANDRKSLPGPFFLRLPTSEFLPSGRHPFQSVRSRYSKNRSFMGCRHSIDHGLAEEEKCTIFGTLTVLSATVISSGASARVGYSNRCCCTFHSGSSSPHFPDNTTFNAY